MRTAKDARQWVYRLTYTSLRKKAAALTSKDVFKDGRPMSDAQLARCKRECLRLADWLEAKAARLEQSEIATTEKGITNENPQSLSD